MVTEEFPPEAKEPEKPMRFALDDFLQRIKRDLHGHADTPYRLEKGEIKRLEDKKSKDNPNQ